MNNPIETKNHECPFLDECAFIHNNRAKMPELVNRIYERYCTKTASHECARYRVYQTLGAKDVPPLMLPDQIDWARQIIEEDGMTTGKDEPVANTE